MILTMNERAFLEVFLHEATTSPFTGPATNALHAIGVDYGDISHLAWAYEQDVPRTSFEIGHPSEESPPLPWKDREAAISRNRELMRLHAQNRVPAALAVEPLAPGCTFRREEIYGDDGR